MNTHALNARAMTEMVMCAAGLFVEWTTNAGCKKNQGIVMVTIMFTASVRTRCWAYAPRLMKNAGIVHAARSTRPQYMERSETLL